ncbi:hypothetical protein HOLleu_24704 [Holothuria leucospilota]|uniref:Uncharacterized protein n=1 Tax=Holothuria leucospilota TaxID=206669 RepID=A0A9Q1H1E0_HOLLE|nr:hypothetical protein HOLleu_24704 [Holothuria leucospilota]
MVDQGGKKVNRNSSDGRILGVPRNDVSVKVFTKRNSDAASKAAESGRKHVTLTLRDVTDYEVWNPVTVSKLKVKNKPNASAHVRENTTTEQKWEPYGRKPYSTTLPRLQYSQSMPTLNFRHGFSLDDVRNDGLKLPDSKSNSPSQKTRTKSHDATPLKSSGLKVGLRRSLSDMDQSIEQARLAQVRDKLGSGMVTVNIDSKDISSPPFRKTSHTAKNSTSRPFRHRIRPSTSINRVEYIGDTSRNSKPTPTVDKSFDDKYGNSSVQRLDQSDYISLAISNTKFVGHRQRPKVKGQEEPGDESIKPSKSVRFGLRDEIFEYEREREECKSSLSSH